MEQIEDLDAFTAYSIMEKLAILYRHHGKHVEALELHDKATTIKNDLLGVERDTLMAKNALAPMDWHGKNDRAAKAPRWQIELTFLVSVKHVQLDYSVQSPRYDTIGFFRPPTISKAFQRGTLSLFRWSNGRMTRITPVDTGWSQNRLCYSEATIFSQQDHTDHLLAVGCDATKMDLPHANHRWDVLSFKRVPVPMKTSSSPPYYSKIDLDGMEGETAAPMSSHLVNQLLPRC